MTLSRKEYLEQVSKKIPKDGLFEFYINQHLSLGKCGKIFGCSTNTIKNYLKKYNIPNRNVAEAQIGRKHLEETKKKIALSKIGKKRKSFSKEWRDNLSKASKGRIPPNKGNNHTEETKKKISKMLKGVKKPRQHALNISKAIVGNKHWNWKGGITRRGKDIINSYEYNKWRKSVYERDNYTCQKCGDNSGGNLNAHHIESFLIAIDLRIEIFNGITLCEACHKRFHQIYGRGNTNRKQLEYFLKDNQKIAL